jgi:hypothetical protein
MVAACVRLQPAEVRMITAVYIVGLAAFGFAMFLWGQLSTRKACTDRISREWHYGFRDGWEAAEQFDNDVRVIWGGRL